MNPNDSIFTNIDIEETEASYFQRLFTTIIDWTIDIALIVMLYLFIPGNVFSTFIKSIYYGTYIIGGLAMILYRLITILSFNRTIGMMICGIKYLNEHRAELTGKEKMLAVLLIRTSKIKYYKA